MMKNLFNNHEDELQFSDELTNDSLDGETLDGNIFYDYKQIELGNIDNLSNINIDLEEFNNGVKSVSDICGKIVALSNVGIPPVVALEFISNRMDIDSTVDSNEKITELNNKASIECSKNGAAFMRNNNF